MIGQKGLEESGGVHPRLDRSSVALRSRSVIDNPEPNEVFP